MNTNTEYELFTQEVYKLLSTYTGMTSYSVQHNVKLKGKSGLEHQIDVYWEYNKDGIEHRVAIECKNYSYGVSIGKVRDFYGVISDLENVKGIMVTTVGYQKGSKQFAEYYGISLKELRTPRDGETIIGEMEWNYDIDVTNCVFLIDEEWAHSHDFDIQEYRERQDMLSINGNKKRSNSFHVPLDRTDEFIRDANGKVVSSIDELKQRIPDKQPDAQTDIYCLKDRYVNNRFWGLIKINEIKFEREYTIDDQTYAIDAGEFVKAILKDALNGDKLVVMDW